MSIVMQSPASPFTGEVRHLVVHENNASLIQALRDAGWREKSAAYTAYFDTRQLTPNNQTETQPEGNTA